MLFVVLAGVGVSLLAGDRSRRRRRRAYQVVALRVAVFLPLGIALQHLDTGVAVILHYYALYFLIAALLLRLPDGALLAGALALFVAGPLAHLAAQMTQPDWYVQASRIELDDPVVVGRDLLLTGYYPAVTWAPPLALGMWLGRRDLRASRVRRALVGGGAAVAAAAYLTAEGLARVLGAPPGGDVTWRTLLDSSGHTEMPFSVIGATAVACAVLGLCLVVADRAPRLAWPLAATGQLALTVYVGHLLVLAEEPAWLRRDTVPDAAVSVGRLLLVTTVLAVAWRAVFARGPLEALLHLPWWRPSRRP